jgi:hypothetical protein
MANEGIFLLAVFELPFAFGADEDFEELWS